MKNRILVAGVGNIFLGDDAFGVEVVQRLRHCSLPEHVTVTDFGVRSYDLAYALMEKWDLVILVDALPRGGEPGRLYTLEPDISATWDAALTPDAHTMNPVSVLQLVHALGGQISRMLVVGCEPETIEPDPGGTFGLSAPVRAAAAEAVKLIQELIVDTRAWARSA
jgi:hydrogenase maturation protease